jgi:hypothetical protein
MVLGTRERSAIAVPSGLMPNAFKRKSFLCFARKARRADSISTASWVAASANARALASRNQAVPKAPPTSDESTGIEGWPEGKPEGSLRTEELRVESCVEAWVMEALFVSMDETGTGDFCDWLDDLAVLPMIALLIDRG